MPLYSTPAAKRMANFGSGQYYPIVYGVGSTTAAVTQSRLRLMPFYIDQTSTFDRIGSSVTAGAASSVLRWTIYYDTGDLPGTLLLDTGASPGTVDSSASGFKEATISLTLPVGRYWGGVVAQGGAPTLLHATGQIAPGIGYNNSGEIASTTTLLTRYQDSVTGAAPSPFTGTTVAASAPMVYLRAA